MTQDESDFCKLIETFSLSEMAQLHRAFNLDALELQRNLRFCNRRIELLEAAAIARGGVIVPPADRMK
jgi:hypothetical protein